QGCFINHRDYQNNQITRIGELHVASSGNIKGSYYYETDADSNMSIGESGNGSNFTAGGSIGIDNSIGAGGSTVHTGGWVKYVDDTMNYVKQKWVEQIGGQLCYYIIQPYSSNGDAYDGTLTPPSNPWGNCASAPYEARINPGGSWDALNSKSVTLMWAFSAFGLFQGSGSTGYQTTNRISYQDNGSSNTYVCGGGGSPGDVQGSPVIYNNPN
ncbi:MAG TPA: hypothetical protein VMU94_03600, partial [Streptosporangiaceae bacterium]|nr:hypothetical protein [Streptosporangiaceae bacterium]